MKILSTHRRVSSYIKTSLLYLGIINTMLIPNAFATFATDAPTIQGKYQQKPNQEKFAVVLHHVLSSTDYAASGLNYNAHFGQAIPLSQNEFESLKTILRGPELEHFKVLISALASDNPKHEFARIYPVDTSNMTLNDAKPKPSDIINASKGIKKFNLDEGTLKTIGIYVFNLHPGR